MINIIFPKQGNYHTNPFQAVTCVGGNVSHGYSFSERTEWTWAV